MSILDTLDATFPLSKATIPKLNDVKHHLGAHRVDELLRVDKSLSCQMMKAPNFLIYQKDDKKNKPQKDLYMDLMLNQCSILFPEELMLLHYQTKSSPTLAQKQREYNLKKDKIA